MANFIWEPEYVTPKKSYPVYLTPSEIPGKKEALLLDDNPELIYSLTFKAVDPADRLSILAHYDGRFGPYSTFTWNGVPSNINGGAAMTVRYAESNPYSEKPLEAGLWEIQINFEVVPA
jgi:hypothetical protein